MGETTPSQYDLNHIVKFLSDGKAIIAEYSKKEGIQYTYYEIRNPDKVPPLDEKYFKSKYLKKITTVTKQDVTALVKKLESDFGITPKIFTSVAPLKTDFIDKNICIYSATLENMPLNINILGINFVSGYAKNKFGHRGHVKTNIPFVSANKDIFEKLDGDDQITFSYNQKYPYYFGFWESSSILNNDLGIYDDQAQSIIKYSNSSYNKNEYLGLYDVLMLQSIMGAKNEQNKGNTVHYHELKGDEPKLIWDENGIDTIKVGGVYNPRDIIDLREGEVSVPLGDGDSFSKSGKILQIEKIISYKTFIENIDFVSSSTCFTILNELSNYVNVYNSSDNQTFYFTDTHIHTDINPKNKNTPISQKLSRQRFANDTRYVGWGHDVFKYHTAYRNNDTFRFYYYPLPPGIQKDLEQNPKKYKLEKLASIQTFIFDVEDVTSFRFYSLGNDLVVTHDSKSLDGKNTVLTSSLRIKDYKLFDQAFVFKIRAKSFKEWQSVRKHYAKFIVSFQKRDKEHYNEKDPNNSLTYYSEDSEKQVDVYRKINRYDKKTHYVAQFGNNKNKKAIQYYNTIQHTYQYIPMIIKWEDVKDNKIEPSKIQSPKVTGYIVEKTTGSLVSVPVGKKLYVGELLKRDKMMKINEYDQYHVFMFKHNQINHQPLFNNMMSGTELLTYKVESFKNQEILSLIVMNKDQEIEHTALIHADSTEKNIKIFQNSVQVNRVSGKSLAANELFKPTVRKISDLSKKDNLTIKNKSGRVSPHQKWSELSAKKPYSLHWKGQGAGVVKTINRYGERKFHMIVFGLGE